MGTPPTKTNGNGTSTWATIKGLLPLIVLLGGFIFQWATVQAQLTQLVENQKQIEARLTSSQAESARHFDAVSTQLGQRITRNEEALKQLSPDLASIKTKLDLLYTLLQQHMEEQ